MKQIYKRFINLRTTHRLAIASCLLTALGWCANTARAGSFDYTVLLDPSQLTETQIEAPDGESYVSFEWNGLYSSGEIGSPQLPVKYLRFMVPTYCNNISVAYKASTLHESRGCSHLPYPAQPPVMTNNSLPPEFLPPISDAYSVKTDKPRLQIIEESFIDGFHHVVTVAVSPVAYNGEDNSVSIFSDITFSLNYDECTEADMEEKPIFPKNYTPFFSLDDNIIDPANIRASNAKRYSASRVSSTGQKEYYYVITPASLKDALSDFVTWKTQKGYTVVVKTIESILASSKFKVNPNNTVWDNKLVDEAASLRAYLRDEYEKNGFFYCLLVGNYKTSMPIRKSYRSSHNLNNENCENLVPTDVYFTDLKQQWNLTKPSGLSLYTSPSPSKFNPSICTGRLLCSTSQEIENWFYKVRIYEANPGYGDNGYLDDAVFFEQWESEGSLIGNSDDIRDFLKDYLNCEAMVDLYATDTSQRGPKGSEVISRISKAGLSSWHGHGNPAGCACAHGLYYITAEDSIYDLIKKKSADFVKENGNGIDNMTNFGKPSLVYSISCDNTPFDYLVFDSGYSWRCRYNLGEAFTVANKTGGPVFLGNTRVGFVIPSKDMELWFFKGLTQNRKIGYAENYSKINYNNTYNSIHLRATHSIIGDSEIEMWLGKPLDNNININHTSSAISFSGNSLAGSKICLYDGEGNYATATASSTSYNFSLAAAPEEFDNTNYIISVWKTGYLPVVRLYGQNATMIKRKKDFIVRDAIFGSAVMSSKTKGDYTVGNGAILNVKAIDSIDAQKGFIIESGGIADFKCDRSVVMSGAEIKKGGSLNINANTVTLKEGFTVIAGGSLTINPN